MDSSVITLLEVVTGLHVLATILFIAWAHLWFQNRKREGSENGRGGGTPRASRQTNGDGTKRLRRMKA